MTYENYNEREIPGLSKEQTQVMSELLDSLESSMSNDRYPLDGLINTSLGFACFIDSRSVEALSRLCAALVPKSTTEKMFELFDSSNGLQQVALWQVMVIGIMECYQRSFLAATAGESADMEDGISSPSEEEKGTVGEEAVRRFASAAKDGFFASSLVSQYNTGGEILHFLAGITDGILSGYMARMAQKFLRHFGPEGTTPEELLKLLEEFLEGGAEQGGATSEKAAGLSKENQALFDSLFKRSGMDDRPSGDR